MRAVYGTMDAELEVKRTVKRGWPTMVHDDTKGIIDGLWRGEMKCIGPQAGDAEISVEVR